MQPLVRVATALACFVAAIAYAAPEEPRYNDQPLSYWVDQLDPTTGAGPGSVRAIRSIGTNGIPFLLSLISYERPLPDRSKPSNADYFFTEGYQTNPAWRAELAVSAFQILGTNATPAVPVLTRLALTSIDDERSERCIDAISYLGGIEALHSIINIITNGSPRMRFEAIGCLPRFHKDAVAAIPALIESLGHETDFVRAAAIGQFARLEMEPELLVPVLTKVLKSSSALRRAGAAKCLKSLRERAHAAAPALREALTDPDPEVRSAAKLALSVVAP